MHCHVNPACRGAEEKPVDGRAYRPWRAVPFRLGRVYRGPGTGGNFALPFRLDPQILRLL